MTDLAWAWIPITIIAAVLQTGRNAIQHHLTEQLGTIGATQVRFLYGFPIAASLTIFGLLLTKSEIPKINYAFLTFITIGAFTQIFATSLMLSAMRYRAFVVVTALTKAEPIEVAIFGFIILNDHLPSLSIVAIIVATAGVILMAYNQPTHTGQSFSIYPVLMGLSSGAFFAIAAVSFRGAILSIEGGNIIINASWSLSFCLAIQAISLCVWMYLFNRYELMQTFKLWRISFMGGLLGALASKGWFLGFALTAAANVRTLGLVEILFAQILTKRIFLTRISAKEFIGISAIILGVGVLLLAQGLNTPRAHN
jgi:drug/metabolite transporter (DMT)-like permease